MEKQLVAHCAQHTDLRTVYPLSVAGDDCWRRITPSPLCPAQDKLELRKLEEARLVEEEVRAWCCRIDTRR